jgi:pimeloyl-ACP methyl ester carboxylesterase
MPPPPAPEPPTLNRPATLRHVLTGTLETAYEESGAGDGVPVFLMHGFPYDPRTYDAMVPALVAAGCRVIVPYLRGYGPTRFLAPETPRSGQQAALGNDLKELIDALGVKRPVLAGYAGYDWGGRAACIVAALWPETVRGLVTANGYNIQDIAGSGKPAPPEQEHRLWYQYYLHTERGRAGLTANRREFCKLLWRLWSPNWRFDDATFERTAGSFDNPDFVDVVLQSYRHRFGYAPGDPALEAIEQRLAAKPRISVPTIVLHGDGSGLSPPESSIAHRTFFTGPYQHRVIPTAGHNLPQEAPAAVTDAVLELVRMTQ